jgi:hypothetical protein
MFGYVAWGSDESRTVAVRSRKVALGSGLVVHCDVWWFIVTVRVELRAVRRGCRRVECCDVPQLKDGLRR